MPWLAAAKAPWPPVAVTIGLFGNALWPLALSATGQSLRERIHGWLGASNPPPHPTRGPS